MLHPLLSLSAAVSTNRQALLRQKGILKAVLVTGVLAAAFPATSFAQVHRCTNSNGQTEYTDKPCAKDAQQVLIEEAKSLEELELDRQRAEDAFERSMLRQQARQDELRLKAEIQQQEQQRIPQPPRPPANYENTVACQDARRTLNRATLDSGRYNAQDMARYEQALDAADRACFGPGVYADIQRQRAVTPAPAPTIIVTSPNWRSGTQGWGHPQSQWTTNTPPQSPAQPPITQPAPVPPPTAVPPSTEPSSPPHASRSIAVGSGISRTQPTATTRPGITPSEQDAR